MLRADQSNSESVIAAAEILACIMEHSPRYGFAGEARECRERLGAAIEAKTTALVAELQAAPTVEARARSYAMLHVVELVLKDVQGAQLARNLRMARQVSAA